MFNGKFMVGGFAKGYTVNLWRHTKEDEEYTSERFKKSLDNGVLGWDGIRHQLLYRDEDGKLWKAKFEETDG